MKYEDFKVLVESGKFTNEKNYKNLRKRLGIDLTTSLFKRYIIEEDALNDAIKFKYISIYYCKDFETDLEIEKNKNTMLPSRFINPISEYVDQTRSAPLLTHQEEKELAIRMNYLYDILKKRILSSNNEENNNENKREIEEIMIDNYFNRKLNSFNYYKTLKIKPVDKDASYKYNNDCSIESRRKQLSFLKKLQNEKLEIIKKLRNNIDSNEITTIKEIELLCKEIEDIKNVKELLEYQIEYLQIIDKFFESNTRLSYKIADNYNTRCRDDKVDLIQAANMGLLTGIKKFNPNMGYNSQRMQLIG